MGLISSCASTPSAPPPSPPAGPKPLLVVFPAEEKYISLEATLNVALTNHLLAMFSEAGGYQVFSREDLKQRLKRNSGNQVRHCYDMACQTRLARKLGADKSFASRVFKNIASQCEVSGVLIKVKEGEAEYNARTQGGCGADEIKNSMDQVVCHILSHTSLNTPHAPNITGQPESGREGNLSPEESDCMFQAKFLWIEEKAELFRQMKLDDSPKNITVQERKMAEYLLSLKSAYEQLIAQGHARWVVASLFRMGELYQHFADRLSQNLATISVPKAIKQKGAKASEEYLAQFNGAYVQRIEPLRAKAKDYYTLCLNRAKEAGRNDDYVRQAGERLHQLESDKTPRPHK